ncbi:repeat protein, partial [Candidatus Thiomargarita nelsonii]
KGHPYLTQKLCQIVATDKSVTRAAGVDRICEGIFFSSRARETENNLQHVRTLLLAKDKDHAALLDLYRQVRARKRIRDDDTNVLINTLRLSGLIRVLENYLWMRNRIYFRVFDRAWIEANMPNAEKRRQKAAFKRGFRRASAVAAVIIALIGGGFYWVLDGYYWKHVRYYNTYAKRLGIMEGVGELTRQQVRSRTVSYKFIREGRYNPLQKVQAVKGSGELAASQSTVKSIFGDQSKDKSTLG